MSSHTRVHYMDNLRAFAMLLGIFFHAALAYSPMLNQIWLTADQNNSIVVDVLAFFSHTFRMPLFFIIAGFFAAMLVHKRGLKGLVRNRLLRIALPLIIFLPLMWISFMAVIGWAIESVETPSPMLGMIKMMSQNPDAPAPPVTTTHLWFLYQLVFFYGLAIIISHFSKQNWLAWLSKSTLLFVCLSPLALVPALVSVHAPMPAPEMLVPQLWSFGFYGLLFALGWGVFNNPCLLDKLRPYAVFMLLVGVACFGLFYNMLPTSVSMQDAMIQATAPPELSATHITLAILQAYCALHISLALLALGQRFLSTSRPAMRYVADASYWVYIIHLPVIWLIQFWLLDKPWSLLTEFTLSTLGTLTIGLLSYALLVRWTPIGWLLNGRKNRNIKEDAIERKEITG